MTPEQAIEGLIKRLRAGESSAPGDLAVWYEALALVCLNKGKRSRSSAPAPSGVKGSLAMFARGVAREGLSERNVSALWAMRVLDAWRDQDPEGRSWGTIPPEGGSSATCLVVRPGASRSFQGASGEAARVAAARTLAAEEPKILEGV